MAGGTGMYIHNYQIHNVLNAYRKQLSQTPAKADAERQSLTASGNTVAPSKKGQPQAIVNQISTEIIDRIARFGPKSEFDNAVMDQMAVSNPDGDQQKGLDFTYTLIDEQNRKTTRTLAMDALNALKYQEGQQDQLSSDRAKEQPAGEVAQHNSETQNNWKG